MTPRRLALLGLLLALSLATAMVTVLRDDDPSADPPTEAPKTTETVAPGAPGATCELEDAVGNVPAGSWIGPLELPDGTEVGGIRVVVDAGRVTDGSWLTSGDDEDEGAVTGAATDPVLVGFGATGEAELTIVAFSCDSVTATVEVEGPLAGTSRVATWSAVRL